MRGPPECERAALAGSPISQNHSHNEDSSLTATDLQARGLHRLFSFCRATAFTIANLAWGCAR
jgi:hypothetical protein